MPFSVRLPLYIVSLLFMIIMFGCGEKTVVAEGGTKSEQSQACIDCHQGSSWNSPGTLVPIVDEWNKSAHNLLNGASCADCHEPEVGHPSSCNLCHAGTPPSGMPGAGNHVIKNPDDKGKCSKCHRRGVSWGNSTYDSTPIDIQYVHYSSGKRANFVTTNYVGNCRKCHNPHDTTSGRSQRQQWSRSGHGDTLAGARTNRYFQAYGSNIPSKDNFGAYCVRCHTSTGFIRYVDSGFSDVNALPDLSGTRTNYPVYVSISTATGLFKTGSTKYYYNDRSREATNCDTCHSDSRSNDGSAYSGRIRKVPSVFGYFNYSGVPTAASPTSHFKYKQTFPDYGFSNVCVACHGGRGVGGLIRYLSTQGLDFTIKQSAVSPHDFLAASNITAVSGFHFYSNPEKYSNPQASGYFPGFMHDKIGMASSGNIGGINGPCAGCHMKNDRSHYFMPVVKNESGAITSIVSDLQTCSKCHKGDYVWTPDKLENEKLGRDAALKALKFMFFNANAYDSTKTDVKQAFQLALYTPTKETTLNNKVSFSSGLDTSRWSVFGRLKSGDMTKYSAFTVLGDTVSDGAYTMGATYNYSAVANDPGSYAHNATYAKRLLYDSIDWLDDGIMNESVATSLPTILDALVISTTNPAVFNPINNTSIKSVTFKVVATTTPRTFSDFTFNSDEMNKAISYLCGTTGKRP